MRYVRWGFSCIDRIDKGFEVIYADRNVSTRILCSFYKKIQLSAEILSNRKIVF